MTNPILNQTVSGDPTQDGDLDHLRNIQLGYVAHAVTINNLTGQWWYAPFLSTFIPPWLFEGTYYVPQGPQSPSFLADTPPGATSTPVAGQKLSATFWKDRVPPVSGLLIPIGGI